MGGSNDCGKVLVVDDNLMNVDLLTSALERYGYCVRSGLSAKSALALIDEDLPEVILLDVSMPEMDGYEFCRLLKTRPDTAEIPVIFISALDETENILKGFDVGAVDYISKPFKFREVLARVSSQILLLRQKREIEERRQRDLQHFKVIDQLRQQFIGSATHDLKNPLFVISGYTEMLEGILATIPDLQDDERIPMCTGAIKRGVDKMNGLVHDMLDLLQLEADSSLDVSEDTLHGFLQNALQDAWYRAGRKQQRFALHLPEPDITIWIDVRRMTRVIDNLLSNAFKYTPEGGEIAVSAYYDTRTFTFEILDSGLGIPQEMLADIFHPFTRVNTEEHMQQEGTGLGLSIVHRIVEQHDGQITVVSELGKGSLFRIMLPRQPR